MSKPRHDWWPYVKGMIRRYPELEQLYGEDSKGELEQMAVRELPGVRQREYEAVRRAVADTMGREDGASRLKVVKLVLWDQRYTVEGAALLVPCSTRTAAQWHGDFIRLVASYYGLLDE